jgi:hypothetical protein
MQTIRQLPSCRASVASIDWLIARAAIHFVSAFRLVSSSPAAFTFNISSMPATVLSSSGRFADIDAVARMDGVRHSVERHVRRRAHSLNEP